MEALEQLDATQATYDEPDPDFASCPREDDEQEELNPPYDLLEGPQVSSYDRHQGSETGTGDAGVSSAMDRDTDADRLASLRVHAEEVAPSGLRVPQVSSPGSRVADSRSGTGGEDVAGQLQQLISAVGVLATRLERVEAASSSDTSSGSQWRPRSDTVNLGYVDHTALDRWYTQAVQDWTGPAGDIGGGPSMPPPGPTTTSGYEVPNPWFSGPAGWFRQVGSWMGPWGLGGRGRGHPQDAQIPPIPGHVQPQVLSGRSGAAAAKSSPGQVPQHALPDLGQVSPQALPGPGQVQQQVLPASGQVPQQALPGAATGIASPRSGAAAGLTRSRSGATAGVTRSRSGATAGVTRSIATAGLTRPRSGATTGVVSSRSGAAGFLRFRSGITASRARSGAFSSRSGAAGLPRFRSGAATARFRSGFAFTDRFCAVCVVWVKPGAAGVARFSPSARCHVYFRSCAECCASSRI